MLKLLLIDAELKKEYVVTSVESDDDELNSFLFTLGCYAGQKITIISINSSGYVIVVKDGRYSIDKELASLIKVN